MSHPFPCLLNAKKHVLAEKASTITGAARFLLAKASDG
jgi:hypothetical protein